MSQTSASSIHFFNASKSAFLISLIAILFLPASHQHQRPRIVSGPSHPVIGRIQGDVTFKWIFTLWPGKTWNESVEEVGFGIWKAPGYLRKKLMVIDKQGDVLILPNHEDKLSCKFNMSRLLVAFTLHNLTMEDVKEYGLHVEFGLTQNPLTDAVMLRLQDSFQTTSPTIRKTDTLTVKDEAEKSTQTAVAKTTPSEETSHEWKQSIFIATGAAILVIVITVVLLVHFRRQRSKSIAYGPQVDTPNMDHSIPSTI